MNRFWNSLFELARVFPRMVTEEQRRLRKSILWLIGFLYAISLFQLIMNSYVLSSIFGFILWVLSIYVIFNIRRIVNIAGVGEALEALRITPVPKAEKAEEGAAAVVINPLNTVFWDVSLQVFFSVTITFLLVPLLPLHNSPLFVLWFPTMAVGIALAFKKKALRVANWMSSVFILFLVAFHFFLLFPEVRATIGLNGLNLWPSSSTSQVINGLDRELKEAKISMVNGDLERIRQELWTHPSHKLTEEEEVFFQQARRGGLKTLAEVTKEIEEAKKKPASAGKSAGEDGVETLIVTLPPPGYTGGMKQFPLGVWLNAGKYRIEPGNTGFCVTQIRFDQTGEKNYRNLEDGQYIRIPTGGQFAAIRTDWPKVKIYKKEG